MGDSQRMRRRRKKLWEENERRCYWCGVQTILSQRRSKQRRATIDHLRSRYHPQRCAPIHAGEEPRTVLACYSCNQKRAMEEEQSIPIEERRRRSGVRPRRLYIHLWRIALYRIKSILRFRRIAE